ncbi:MAG: hypothetical protein KY459_09195 [Acidobacteria bacterium]|nr:hypothetical protein [Acidobacteriota bacterium]
MSKSFKSWLMGAVLIAIGVAAGMWIGATDFADAGGKTEYKFVRLLDVGSMPAITEALNLEAERGYELKEMEALDGQIYLIFAK